MDKKSTEGRRRGQSRSPARNKSPGRPPKSKSPGRPKSPTKSKSPGRTKSKSPARRKSPVRSPSASRKYPSRSGKKTPIPEASPVRTISPVRKTSPVRKLSPVRKFTTTDSIKNSFKEQLLRRSPFVQLERKDDLKPERTSVESLRNEEMARERSVSLPKASTSSQISQVYSMESSVIRRSSRLRQDEELDKITKVMNAEVDKILKANNVPQPSQYEYKPREKPIREFGSWPGALLTILLMPALALILQMSCTKSKGAGLAQPTTYWKAYLDLHTAGYYLAFVAWQILLSSIPLGRKASYGLVHTRLSGFYNSLLTFFVLGGLYYYGFNVTSVMTKSLALLTSAIITALLLALVLFVKGGRTSSKRNVNADGNKLYDFFIGREVHPTVGPLSIKALLTRMEFVGIMLLDGFYLLKYIETHAAGVYSPTLLFVVLAHTLYVFDTLWFEEKFMTSFEAQHEGVGYMTAMAAATWPFLLTYTTRYIFYTNYEAPTYRLAICGVFFLLGYYVYRASNSLKAEFRQNPQNPVFSDSQTVSTFLGKRLLCDRWWKIVRHPNYLGDMVMMWSVAAVCGLSHWLPYVFPLVLSAVLVHRTFRVSTHCKSIYGVAWDRYTQLVKYRLVPRIF